MIEKVGKNKIGFYCSNLFIINYGRLYEVSPYQYFNSYLMRNIFAISLLSYLDTDLECSIFFEAH